MTERAQLAMDTEPTPSGLYHPGWRRELGDSEVAEAYMDAKFGGEGADMVEIVGGW